MSDSLSKLPQLTNSDSICKINISGYSLDEFKNLYQEVYTIICNLGKGCDHINYFPTTSKIVLTSDNYSQLYYSFQRDFFPNLTEDLGVREEVAVEKVGNFLANTELRIQPIGIQGKVYNAMRAGQDYLSMTTSTKAVVALKTTGYKGLDIISKGQGPLVFIGITYLGSVVTGYAGSVAGDNSVGLFFNGTSWLLSRPMRGTEVILNGLILGPISRVTGLPVILNGTQELLNGKGIEVKDYNKIGAAFDRVINSKIVKKVKDIIAVLKN